MKNFHFQAAAALCLMTALPLFAQDTAEHNRRTAAAKDATVVIEGCIAAGQKADTYVLATVREVEAVPVAHLRKRIYWLDSTKGLEDQVGHQVRITGRVQDLERADIEIEAGAGPNGGAVATIEGPGSAEVDVAAAKIAVGAASGTAATDKDVPTTLIKIKVSQVTRLAATCK